VKSNANLTAQSGLLTHLSALTPQERVQQKAAIFYGKADSV